MITGNYDITTDVERHEDRMDEFYARIADKTTWDGIDLAIVEELMAE